MWGSKHTSQCTEIFVDWEKKLPIQAIRGIFEETVEHDFQNFHIIVTEASKNDQTSVAGIKENLSFAYGINHNNSIFSAGALAICQALDDLTVPNKNLLILSDSLCSLSPCSSKLYYYIT
ncbi:putative RNA-directed DNA polymerase from transposon BS [Trichonephila clavipes]|nr:putative RNA-directed DNA polymerase from transposon BS [Trichonephila clavipes]